MNMKGGLIIGIVIPIIIVVAIAAFWVQSPSETQGSMKITSSAFTDGGQIPQKYTADGDNVSPPLSIENVPDGAVTLALIMDDPDDPGGTFTHWLIWNIQPAMVSIPEIEPVTSIPENVPTTEIVGTLDGARQGINDFGEIGYGGPSPPSGSPHHYRFTVYALDTTLELEAGATREQLEAAMESHVLGQATLTGIYQR